MSLLKVLPYKVYSDLLKRRDDWATKVAKLANLRINTGLNSGKDVINELDRRGYSVDQFYQLLDDCEISPNDHISKNQNGHVATLKVAILHANAHYEHWANLVTPITDCRTLGKILNSIGFIVIILEDTTTDCFKIAIDQICSVLPSDSYVIFYFAGHGFELCGTKYMLGIECPEKCTIQNGVSENFVIKHGFENKPKLFVLLLDMCRKPPDRLTNPEIYENIPPLDEYKHNCNLIVGYATSPYMPSYEKLFCDTANTMSQTQHDSCEMNYSTSYSTSFDSSRVNNTYSDCNDVGNRTTRQMKSGKNLSGISLYVSRLSKHLRKDEDFVKILEMVHKDFANEQSEQVLLQKPQKLDNVAEQFYLSHKAKGDAVAENNLRDLIANLKRDGLSVAII